LSLDLQISNPRSLPTYLQSLYEISLAKPSTFKALAKIISAADEFNGMTFLHAVVRHDPPVQIISEMIQLCPQDVRSRDCLHRTPLHVACGVGAGLRTIQCLTAAYPGACRIQDEDGRTPLHFACDIECQLFEGDDSRMREPPSYEVIHCLLSASLSVVGLEDADGMSPLEYAICSDSDVKVVKLLQKAAQKHMRDTEAKTKQLGMKEGDVKVIAEPGSARVA
jgi:ankyrin repeat protein